MPAGSVISPLVIAKGATVDQTGEGTLFEHAPPAGLQQWLGLVRPDNLNIRRRALLVILVCWVPLIAFAIAQSPSTGADVIGSVFREVGLHARYLIAAPLLVLAEAVCAPELNAITRHFIDGGIIADRDRARFDEALASTRTLLQSNAAEVIVFALAYVLALTAVLSHPPDQLPAWAVPVGVMPRYSLAGWWHMLVSLPLLLALVFGWFWRLALWGRLLRRISHLELRLVASHPDRCAGLRFLSHSVGAFAIVGLALASIIAGRSAHVVLAGGGIPTPHLAFNVVLLVTIAALFTAPLLAFTPTLMRAWRCGTLAYDALAEQVGHAFEGKWLAQKADQAALDKPDFSATTDLYSVVANVHAIRFVPVELKDLIAIAAALLLPFVPVVLLAFPADVIWMQMKNLKSLLL